MRKLGDQWIENGRMWKAVAGSACKGCAFGIKAEFYHAIGGYTSHWFRCTKDGGCPFEDCENIVIKDLGPVNEEGCLAEERTGEFPRVINIFDGLWKVFVYVNNDLQHIEVGVYGSTKQEAIDRWNMREAL